MLVSDRCYCIHQPKTAITSLPRVLGKMREALAIPQGIALMVADEGRCDRIQAIPQLRFQPEFGKNSKNSSLAC